MFQVGQKVVCVDANGSPSLSLGGVYTIKQISPPDLYLWRGNLRFCCGLLLHEVDARFEGGFAPERFRPVTERKTSIEIFQRMLTPHKESEHV